LQSFILTCRDACASFPSFEVVAPAARIAAVRAMESQGYHHALALRSPPLPTPVVERWAARQWSDGGGFSWWEILGAAGSSLAILALMATAGKPNLKPVECELIERLYFPWAGALLGLMDSIVDQVGDEHGGQHSLTGRYGTRHEAAARLGLIAARSLELTAQLPDGRRHALIIAAMTSFFATEVGASLPDAHAGAGAALAALGPQATLPMAALRAWRCAGRLPLSRLVGP
jgi:tetraprenyl-beta-curcumene synthase